MLGHGALLDPDAIHTPGIYVHRIINGSPYDKQIEKRIERVTTRPRETAAAGVEG